METWGWVRIQRFICFLNITEGTNESILNQLGDAVDSACCHANRLSLGVDVLDSGVLYEFSVFCKRVRWTTDNVCGHLRVPIQNISPVLLRKVAENDKSEHFYGTNRVFHTVTGRFTVQDNSIVDFKGVRNYDDILCFQRNVVSGDNGLNDSVFYQMIAASFHFNFPVDLREGPSLFLYLMNGFASWSFVYRASMDQNSLLNFKLQGWDSLLNSIERLWSGAPSPLFEEAKTVLQSQSCRPRAFFQITRNSIIFVRVAMQQGVQVLSDNDVVRPYFVILGAFFAAILSQMGFPVSPAECVDTLFRQPQNSLR